MEQHEENVGTKKDLCFYRIQTAKAILKSEIFPRDIGRKIGEIEEIRHASDYDDFYIASREETERQITVADEFIQLIERYCKTESTE